MDTYERSDLAGPNEQAPRSEGSLPADFTPEEAWFVEELRGFFAPERDEPPPLYVQTLMGEPAHRPLESSFEQKTTYQVFRQLGLPRRPLFDDISSLRWKRPSAVVRRLGRQGGVLATCMLVLMVLSVVLASPSFAAGMRILFGQTGVQQVSSYPTSIRASASMVGVNHQTLHQDPSTPLTTVEWLGPEIAGYTYQAVSVNTPQEWSDGPVIELRYVHSAPTPGSGTLDIREFRISPSLASILQVVAEGSAVPVMIGDREGVYVDGKWMHTSTRPFWQPGVRGELIFERDGLIFWIVADQRDGMGQQQLVAAAEHLTLVPLHTLLPQHPSLRMIGLELQGALQDSSDNDVLALIPAGSSPVDGPAAFVQFAPGTPLLH
jgi:hypothetical protein